RRSGGRCCTAPPPPFSRTSASVRWPTFRGRTTSLSCWRRIPPMPDKPVRLQAYLARAGIASRRASEDLIRAGKVTVNGVVAEIGASVDPAHDSVEVDGRVVT